MLTQVFTEVAKLEYSTFENLMRDQVPVDESAASFVLVMNITGKVVANVGAAANKAKSYFRRYIQDNYVAACAEAGGVVSLSVSPALCLYRVNSHDRTLHTWLQMTCDQLELLSYKLQNTKQNCPLKL